MPSIRLSSQPTAGMVTPSVFAELPFDILIQIALALPLRDAVLLSTISRSLRTELASKREFWSSLLLHHRGSRPFKIPMFEDNISIQDLDSLKDIILSSLKLDKIKHDIPPTLRSKVELHTSSSCRLLFSAPEVPLGMSDDHKLLFTAPGTDYVVTTCYAQNAAHCWNRMTGALLCSITFPDNVFHGAQEELKGYCTVYPGKNTALYGLHNNFLRSVNILQLNYENPSAPTLRITYTGTATNQVSESFIIMCVRPGFLAILTLDFGNLVNIRIIDTTTGHVQDLELEIPDDSLIANIAPTIIDDHLLVCMERLDGITAYRSSVSMAALLNGRQTGKASFAGQDRPMCAVGEGQGDRDTAVSTVTMVKVSDLWFPGVDSNASSPNNTPHPVEGWHIRNRYRGHGIFAAPHSSQCVIFHTDATSNTAMISCWNLDAPSPGPVSGAISLAEFPYSGGWLSGYASRWCRTIVAEAKLWRGGRARIQVAKMIRFYEDGGHSVVPLVLPEGSPDLSDVTDLTYDDAKGVLILIANGQTMYCFEYTE